jgi:hypothetical protein
MQALFKKSKVLLAAILSFVSGVLLGLVLGQSSISNFFPGIISAAWWILLVLSLLAAAGYRLPVKSLPDKAFFPLTLFLCSLALGSSVSASCIQLHRGEEWWFRLAGFIPFSDACGYYEQAINWPAEHLAEQSSRRPWNAALNLAAFHLSGRSLLVLLLIKAMLTAGAIAAVIDALSIRAGRLPAWFAGTAMLYFAWPQVPLMMTEINGLIFTATGIALLLYGLASEKKWLLVWGIISMLISGQLRPYNPLMPYVFIAGILFIFPTKQHKFKLFLFSSLLAFAFNFFTSRALYSAYGHPGTSINGNIDCTLLGLARGTNWWEAQLFTYELMKKEANLREGSPEANAFHPSESEISAKQRSLIIPTIRENPRLLFRALNFGLYEALKRYYVESMEWAGLEPVTKSRFNKVLFPLFYALIVLLPLVLFRRYPAAICMLVLTFFTFLSFAPVVYGDGGWRIVAPLFPGLALFPLLLPLGLEWLMKRPVLQAVSNEVKMNGRPGIAFARGLVIAMLVLLPYPAVVRLFMPPGGPPAQDVFEVRLDDSVRPGWTGFNSAVASEDVMANWVRKAEQEDFGGYDWSPLARFFAGNVGKLKAVKAVDAGIVLVLQDSAAAAEYPDSTKVPLWFSQVSMELAAGQ